MEVKFKVWNKKDKQMIDWFTITQNAWNTFRGETPLSLIYDVLVARKDDFEVLPFTGLLDKNKNEIYLGDILKLDETPDILKGTEFHNTEDISHHEIYWDKERAMFTDRRLEDGDCLAGYLDGDISFSSDCVIVGNIYQVPEYLQGDF